MRCSTRLFYLWHRWHPVGHSHFLQRILIWESQPQTRNLFWTACLWTRGQIGRYLESLKVAVGSAQKKKTVYIVKVFSQDICYNRSFPKCSFRQFVLAYLDGILNLNLLSKLFNGFFRLFTDRGIYGLSQFVTYRLTPVMTSSPTVGSLSKRTMVKLIDYFLSQVSSSF